MALAEHACRICGERELEEIPEFGSLARVTSDCKPFAAGGRIAVCGNCGAVQKPADAQWHADADTIYRAYEVYFQSGGVEQAVFDPATGTPRLRSAVLLDRLDEASPQPQSGKVLDVGCGNGALLSAFAAFRPRWQLWGHELSALNEPTLSRIPGFSGLYTGALADLPPGFDVITMMHSLEHFPEPIEALRALRPKLAEHGRMLIEVPDAEATPFDLLVADHASHFAQRDLARLLARAGLDAVALRNDWVTKELSAVAVPAKAAEAPPPRDPRDALRRVQAQIRWLHHVVAGARQAADRGKPFGLFGTSIAAMWLFGQLGERVAFFVDEDPSRSSATLFGRPILKPTDIPAGSATYVALIPPVARAVAARIGQPGFDLVVPPALAREPA